MIVLVRHPLDAYMAEFNRYFTKFQKTEHTDLNIFQKNFRELFIYGQDGKVSGIQSWIDFHETILEEYSQNIHVVQFENLKQNLVEEMSKLLKFLGHNNMTSEIRTCILADTNNAYKRKSRPKEEIEVIYSLFSNEELKKTERLYLNYLNKLTQNPMRKITEL